MDEVLELKEKLQTQRPAPWDTLPDLALYMDQLLALVNRQSIHFSDDENLTAAMVNNYIKDGVMPRADGKRYSETHLAHLTEISVLKQVLSVRELALLVHGGADDPAGYDHFCAMLDQALTEADSRLSADLTPAELPEQAMRFALLSYSYALVCRRLTELMCPQEPSAAELKKEQKARAKAEKKQAELAKKANA